MLSIDPSSPFTRGALLGDRIRLSEHFLDPGVFIRSMASRGALGGLSEAALQVALVMDAAGKDDVLIETVGVGQAEIDIVDHADTIVLALMPGSGDSIQALKAGVMEIPDVIVVNKADHPMTDTMVREVRGVLALAENPDGWKVPILRTEAARGRGGRGAGGEDRRAPRPHRGGGDAGGAPCPQPPQRGARDRRLADAAPAGGHGRRRPRGGGAAGRGGQARDSTRRRAAGSCSSARPMTEGPAPRRYALAASLEGALGWLGRLSTSPAGRRRRASRRSSRTRRAGARPGCWPRSGRFGKVVAIPFHDCAAVVGRVWVPYSREELRAAPTVDPARPLTREQELEICAGYGIHEGTGRAQQVEGRPRGTLTSQAAPSG